MSSSSDSPDPFRHYPHLRGKIADPFSSRFREMDVADIDARMLRIGMPITWRRTDEAREALRAETLRGREDAPLWLFGYGSLIWDPGICFDEVRIGTVQGLHRRFCLRSELGRGSPEAPGMMVGLDEGGSCESVLFRIPAALVVEETRRIWCREMLRHTYRAQFVDVDTPQGKVEALTFVIDHKAESYLPDIDLEQAAAYVARGRGIYGSSLEYVENLASQLDAFGIPDRSVSQLLRLARELTDGV